MSRRPPQPYPLLSRRQLVLAGLLLPLTTHALERGAPAELLGQIASPRLQGSGRLTFFRLHIYDARLWVGSNFRVDDYSSTPLAIELEYARTLYGKLIAERSIIEMKNLAEIPEPRALAWQAELTQILPDVKQGDRITGVQNPGQSTRLFLNGRQIGEIRDAEFTRLFFGIWLSPRSSESGLREALTGGGQSASAARR